jgi:acetyl-CoA carboxylase biotin carboxyl carrier protein
MSDLASPAPGVLWHRRDPNSPPFCQPGDPVATGQQVALLEVMKMFAPVEAELAGTFVGYAVEDGQTVEAGQTVAIIQAI